MSGHKCDGCRYKGEHVEMGFKPFGVCYKETNLIEAEKNYNAETCPYKYTLPQLYETVDEPEAEPVQWPKENPFINPDQEAALQKGFEELAQALKRMAEILSPAMAALGEAVGKIAQLALDYTKLIAEMNEIIIDTYPHKRVIHLAKHGKPRTRKKNINRIAKDFKRTGRNPALFAQE